MSARRVLVVDDEDMVRLSLCDMLEIAGCEVIGEAADGDEAVAQARSLRPDVVLMDINMPRKDGVEAAGEIMASAPAPVVFLTAYADTGSVSRANEAGGYAYLVKPCRQADLMPAMETAIARFRQTRKHQEEAESVRWALETVRRLSREVVANADIGGVVGLALRCVLSALRVPAAALMLVQRDYLRIREQLGLDPAYADAFQVPVGDGVFGGATVSGQPAGFSKENEESLRGPWPSHKHPFGLVGSALAVPLHDGDAYRNGEALGCLAVFRPEAAAFTPAEVSALAALAGELMVAFQVTQTRHPLAWRAWRDGERRS